MPRARRQSGSTLDSADDASGPNWHFDEGEYGREECCLEFWQEIGKKKSGGQVAPLYSREVVIPVYPRRRPPKMAAWARKASAMLPLVVLGVALSLITPEMAGQRLTLGRRASQTGTAEPKELRRTVEDLNRKQIEAFMKGDMPGVARFYADDATIYFPNYTAKKGDRLSGKAAIENYWSVIKTPKEWKLEVAEVGGTTGAIWVVGRSTLTHDVGGKLSTYASDFVVIWKRQPDGTYRIHTDIYN